MSLLQRIINTIESRRDKKRKSQPGEHGNFWRNGGNSLLYEDLPVNTDSLVIDAGAYKGEWSIGMISRYGCRSILFEPIPKFTEILYNYFNHNSLVTIHQAALGGENRLTRFSLLDNGTSEHLNTTNEQSITSKVLDIAEVIKELGNERIACIKLNIEGGEYEVLERLIQENKLNLCDSLLIQFHRQPIGYDKRYKEITQTLRKTHIRKWGYDFIWELWVIK